MKAFTFIVIVIVLGAGALLAGSTTGPIVFEEIAERSGLTFVSDSSPTPNKNQPETMVAGVALFDYDNDGYLDVYMVNGAAIPSLQKEGPKYWNRLYHNNHDGTFTDVTEKAGVAGAGFAHGRGDRRLRQRWLARHLHRQHREKSTLPQQWRRHVHRRYGKGRRGRGHARWQEDVVGLGSLGRLQQRRPARPVCIELLQVGSQQRPLLRPKSETARLLPPQQLRESPKHAVP